MENRIITISIIGVGARGAEAYGRYIHACKDKFKIVSLCDVNEYRLENAGYNPYAQMRGFLLSGDARFITRSGGAREMILTIDPHYLQRYLNTLRREQEVKRYV